MCKSPKRGISFPDTVDTGSIGLGVATCVLRFVDSHSSALSQQIFGSLPSFSAQLAESIANELYDRSDGSSIELWACIEIICDNFQSQRPALLRHVVSILTEKSRHSRDMNNLVSSSLSAISSAWADQSFPAITEKKFCDSFLLNFLQQFESHNGILAGFYMPQISAMLLRMQTFDTHLDIMRSPAALT